MTQNDPVSHDSDRSNDSSGADHLAAAARQAEQDVSFDELREKLQEELPELELGECIGRGGMGAVFRARQRKLDRSVAVKALLPPPGDAKGWGERFRREAQALARLQHPGIVTIHDYGQSGDLAWLVMELVEGTSLRVLMEGERLSPSEALAVVPPICEALQYAHDRGIVHRDVKPENVLLDTDGRVRLVDFGLAKLSTASEEGHLTRSDQAMGTPRYMAPEQLERPLEVDHRADIFSLGVVFYEMLTGQVPAGVVDPPSRKASIDVRLDEVVLRALQREPERRYQSASDLGQSAERAGTGEAVRDVRVQEEIAPSGEAVPLVGFTLADLLALLMLPISLTLVAFSQMGIASHGVTWDYLRVHSIVLVLWLVLPITTTIHWILVRVRGAALPPAMPTVRTVWAIALTVLTLFAIDAYDIEPRSFRRSPEFAAQFNWALIGGFAVALLGAWSQKGTHRRLVGPTMERALFGLTALFAAIATFVGMYASFSDATLLAAPTRLHDSSLPFTLHLPVLAGGVVAAAQVLGGKLRGATLCLTIGAALTLSAHLILGVSYGGASSMSLVCLVIAALAGLVAIAGSAEPQVQEAKEASRLAMRFLGLATLAPLLGLTVTLVQVLDTFSPVPERRLGDATVIASDLSGTLGIVLFYLIITLPLMFSFMWDAWKRAEIEDTFSKVIWCVLLFALAPFTLPVYWYRHLRKPKRVAAV